MVGYPSDQLHEEVACLAFHFHWSLADILALDHRDRRHWITTLTDSLLPPPE